MTIVTASSAAAALAATAACPAASAEGNAHEQAAKPRVASQHERRSPRGGYVYKFAVGSNENGVGVDCGSPVRLQHVLLKGENVPAVRLAVAAQAEQKEYTVTIGASTRVRVTGALSSELSDEPRSLCKLGENIGPNENGEVNPGIFTWRLARPAKSLNALLQRPATEAQIAAYET